MYEILARAKPSRTVGNDNISMDFLKQIPASTAQITAHLFNRMLQQQRFPSCLKIARIMALKKKGKCHTNPESFRPISILHPVEKLLEEAFRDQLVSYFEENRLIPESHHGGRVGHSTLSAKICIDKSIAETEEEWECDMVLATGLSKAYDLIDHDILVRKLEFYGCSKESTNFIQSFLSDRSFFVEIQGFCSSLKSLGNCSVVQGSKSGVFFYSVYTIEVTSLPLVMRDAAKFLKFTGKNS